MADSYVCSGATMRCTMGTSQAKLTVLPDRVTDLTGKPMANISDHKTMVNLGAFGRCRSMGFPATASATAAAQGTLTPMPCMHNTPFPWMGGKNDYLIKGQPALLKSSKCQCMWGGTISLVTDGQSGEGSQWTNIKEKTIFSSGTNPKKKNALSSKMVADVSDIWSNVANWWNDKLTQQAVKIATSLVMNAVDQDSARKQILRELSGFLESKPEWFRQGYLKLDVNEPGNESSNGYTYLDGSIYLREDIMKDTLNAFKKIKDKKKLSWNEERSLATLWHEINHNMHDITKDIVEVEDEKTKQCVKRYIELTEQQTYYMETANEFVARKTLPDFYAALGVEMHYTEFMSDRENTGYNTWVKTYQKAIEDNGLNKGVVIETVKEGLYNGDYHTQKENLINGLVQGGKYYDSKTGHWGYIITAMQAKKIVEGIL